MIERPSPNFGPRRHGRGPDMVVLHHTAMQTCEDALARLCDPSAEVSAHYVIDVDGTAYRLVGEDQRAWHAGAGKWGDVDDVNSHSIGIELVNPGPLLAHPPYPERQMACLENLLRDVMGRWNIRPERVIAHSDMAPDRKTDPGAKFDWQRLARQGLSVWPLDSDCPDAGDVGFRAAATSFGYSAEYSDAVILRAFRLRFRPAAVGAVTIEDLRIIRELSQRFPVDRTPSAK